MKPSSSDKKTSDNESTYPEWTGLQNRTLWDWLNLLIVPLVLLVGGFLLANWQESTQRSIANQRASSQLKVDNEREQNTLLQEYFDEIGVLMLQYNLDDSEAFGNANAVARARTLTLLRSLDGEHKGAVLQFLRDSGLISETGRPGVVLRGADFSSTKLSGASLSGASLYEVDLSDSDLSNSDLAGVDLRQADLRNTDLSQADLSGTLLNDANLTGAKFRGAILQDVSWKDSKIGYWQVFKCLPEEEFENPAKDIPAEAEIEGVTVGQRNLSNCLSGASPESVTELSERQILIYP